MDCSDGSPKVPGAVWTNLTHQAFVVFPISCLSIGLRLEIGRRRVPRGKPPDGSGTSSFAVPLFSFRGLLRVNFET